MALIPLGRRQAGSPLSYAGPPPATNPLTKWRIEANTLPMDSAALRHALEACHGESLAWALNCCGRDRSEAEDVLQTVYLKILDGRARFDGRASFTTWLFAVIRRTAADARRRHALRALRLAPLLRTRDAPTAAPRPDDQLQASERRAVLARALAQLPRRQREVLLLVFYHDRTVEDAAAILGIGAGSARTHYARGKDRLRRLLRASGLSDEA